jgi:hypothetical protein
MTRDRDLNFTMNIVFNINNYIFYLDYVLYMIGSIIDVINLISHY